MNIPFLDLKPHVQAHREEFDAAVAGVLDSAAFAGGVFTAEFEKEYAAYCGSAHAIGVGNGTDALWMALLALGVGPGDEVITVPGSFMATCEAILLCGAVPVFVDIDSSTYGMNPALLKGAITARTKAIIPVHLFGHPVDMDPVLKVAGEHGIPVVEDAAQAHGARYKGRRAGTLGRLGCFSFYPGKNLGAFGEAGAVVTDDAELADWLRQFRDHGQDRKYSHRMMGWNCRMDGIQAAVLRVSLRYLDDRNAMRRSRAALYDQLLKGAASVMIPHQSPWAEPCYHIYAVRVPNRDRVMEGMAAAGISCGIHYPVPIHLQPACRKLGFRRGDFPVAEQCADQFLSLPMFPELTDSQVAEVAATLTGLTTEKPTRRKLSGAAAQALQCT